MADYVKSTVILEVTTVDDQNNETIFKLEDPKDNLTLASVRSAYADIIAAGYLYSKQGYEVKAVARAARVETTIERSEFES